MKKCMTLLVLALLLVCFAGCSNEDTVLQESKTYEITSEIHSLEIRINAAEFTIERADSFSVVSNLKHLSVSEKDGVLTIVDEWKGNQTYTDAMLTLTIPADGVFEDISITTGAAKLTADALAGNDVMLILGAGDVNIKSLDAYSHADIKGGAGKITIAGGTLNDLDFEMGMGELDLTACLRGENDFALGVGESNITLIGSKDDYTVDIEKGLGSITVDGQPVSDYNSSGSGQTDVEIEGGIGAIHLNYREADAG